MSQQARQQSYPLESVLVIEIQIYFSCLLGKRLAFYTDAILCGSWQLETKEFASMMANAEQLTDNVYIRFNTIMTKACPVSDYIGPPPVTDLTISNQKPYVLSWLPIDYKKGEWPGEYGWPASKAGQTNTRQAEARLSWLQNK